MVELWVVIAVMTVVALALLLPPLLRRPPEVRQRAAFDMEVYRDQITEIDRDLQRGIVSEREAADARAEVGRRLLAADRQLTASAGETGAAALPTRNAYPKPVAAAITLFVPVLAVALYLLVGSPDIPSAKPGGHTVAGGPGGTTSPEMISLVEELGRRLKDRPDDARGWALYARSLAGIGRLGESLDAFRRAVALDPKDVELLSRFAEAQILFAKGSVTPEARRTLESVLAIQAGEPRARFYLALAEHQAGRDQKALDLWLALEADSAPNAPWRKVVSDRIAALAQQMGIGRDELAAKREKLGSRPAPDQPGAMIHAMVDRLAKRLEEDPNDADGWRRLARSYTVLGEPAKARDALAHAAKLLPDNVEVLADYAVSIVQAADKNAPLPPELQRVTAEILKRNSNHPAALWYSGLGKMQSGDTAGALELWKRLRGQLKPGTKQFQDLSRRIEELEKRSAK